MRYFFLVIFCITLALTASAQDSYRFDFGGNIVEKGYTAVDNTIPYTPEKGYGWVNFPEYIRDRKAPNALLRDYIFGRNPATFKVKLEPSLYKISITAGDMEYGNHILQVLIPGSGISVPDIKSAAGEFTTVTFTVDVKSNELSFNFGSPTRNWALNALVIEKANATEPVKFSSQKFSTSASTAEQDKGQKFCLSETDPSSPRHTMLKSNTPSDEIIRLDLNKDDKPDMIERWWNGKRVRWFDENANMKPTDIQGDMVNDSLQIDRDGDGFYDGPGDMNVKWVDNDKDGKADFQLFTINPSKEQEKLWGGASHYMFFEDIDKDNVLASMNWEKFDFEGWAISGKGNFLPDYHGNSIFLKVHLPPFILNDTRLNWENPFAFYDYDGDGVSEMAIRVIDTPEQQADSTYRLDGIAEEAYNSYDLDNDSGKDNEMDYDLTFRFAGGEKMDYRKFKHPMPALKAPDWVLPYYRYTNWRSISELIYVPHDKAYAEIHKPKWESAWLTMDEDDDDHRWERVELYYPYDPYITGKWSGNKPKGLAGHPQADSLGDRGEFDKDNSGRGKIYIGSWDRKIHLYGAEWGAWLVDTARKYWGSSPVVGDSSPLRAEAVEEVVQYYDTDNNGFIDKITYDYNGDKVVDFSISLLDYATSQNPHPDMQTLITPVEKKWEGMHLLFNQISEQSWQEAWDIYRVIWRKGLSNPELEHLAIASSQAEKYDHAYWLKERIIRMLLPHLKDAEKKEILRLYYTGNIPSLVKYLDTMDMTAIQQSELKH